MEPQKRNEFKLEQIVSKIKQKYQEQALNELTEELKLLDQKLFATKPKNFIVKDICSKLIWTPYTGNIKIKRRRYFNKKTKKYVYLLDQKLNLDKRKYISKQYQKLALFFFNEYRSYQAIAKHVFQGEVRKMSIHNFIKNYQSPFTMESHFCHNYGILWINADSLWLKANKSKQGIELKNLVFFTGRKYDGFAKKWELEGRTLKSFYQGNFKYLTKEVENIIHEYSGVREIRIVGDGARWIKNLAKAVGGIYYIDKFHYHKYINDLMGPSFEAKERIYRLILSELPKRKLKLKLYQLVANYQKGEITKKQMKLIGYLVNNVDFYVRNVKYDNPINCIEAIQAHYLVRYFKKQRKGWSPKILNIIINFLYSRQNGGDQLYSNFNLDYYYQTTNGYCLRASIPGTDNPRMAAMFYKNKA